MVSDINDVLEVWRKYSEALFVDDITSTSRDQNFLPD